MKKLLPLSFFLFFTMSLMAQKEVTFFTFDGRVIDIFIDRPDSTLYSVYASSLRIGDTLCRNSILYKNESIIKFKQEPIVIKTKINDKTFRYSAILD